MLSSGPFTIAIVRLVPGDGEHGARATTLHRFRDRHDRDPAICVPNVCYMNPYIRINMVDLRGLLLPGWLRPARHCPTPLYFASRLLVGPIAQ
jgi:hypothetical protein